MNSLFSPVRNTVAALGLAAAGAAASAAVLPSFTIDPSSIPGVVSPAFTANNLLVSDYSTVTFKPDGTFTDMGFLSISAAQTTSSTFTPAGLNTDYGFYIQFSGSGITPAGDPATEVTKASFSTLSYTIYGYAGSATFDFSGNTPTTTAMNPIALASGTLIKGSAVTVPNDDGSFTPSASATLTLNLTAAGENFFVSPDTFYNLATTAFTNTSSQVEPFADGFRIRQGGGSINFATAVPEPGSYALLMAGLGVVGFVARRKALRR